MSRLRLVTSALLFLLIGLGTFSCGVKGPPLPPLPTTPEQSDSLHVSQPNPGATSSPAPSAPAPTQ